MMKKQADLPDFLTFIDFGLVVPEGRCTEPFQDPNYQPPEHVLDKRPRPMTSTLDVWSTGASLFEAICQQDNRKEPPKLSARAQKYYGHDWPNTAMFGGGLDYGKLCEGAQKRSPGRQKLFELVKWMLTGHPDHRPKASEVLKHEEFDNAITIEPPVFSKFDGANEVQAFISPKQARLTKFQYSLNQHVQRMNNEISLITQ